LLPVDALQGLNVLQQLAEIGVKPEQIPDFIQAVKKVSEDVEYQPQKVTQAAIKLHEIEAQSGTTYPQATKNFETLTQQNAKLGQENSQLQREILENKKKRKQTLKQANMTENEISHVNLLESSLRQYGVDLHDTENLLKYLANTKEMKCTPRRFVSLSKRHGSLTRSLTRINDEISEKLQTRGVQEREIETAETKILELQSSVERCQEAANQASEVKSQLEIEVDTKKNELRKLKADIAEKEVTRQALIVQNAKLSGVPESEIQQYLYQKNLDLLVETSKARIRGLLGKYLS
jgi:chromosome segregation ATPase